MTVSIACLVAQSTPAEGRPVCYNADCQDALFTTMLTVKEPLGATAGAATFIDVLPDLQRTSPHLQVCVHGQWLCEVADLAGMECAALSF